MRWGAITTPAARRPGRATATAIAPGSCAARRGRSNTARRRLPTAASRSARRFARSFAGGPPSWKRWRWRCMRANDRSEEHTSELQSHHDLVCRLLLEKKKKKKKEKQHNNKK